MRGTHLFSVSVSSQTGVSVYLASSRVGQILRILAEPSKASTDMRLSPRPLKSVSSHSLYPFTAGIL